MPTVTGTAWTRQHAPGLPEQASRGRAAPRGKGERAWRRGPRSWSGTCWERLRDLFECRKTGTSPEPRWLLSGIATCGVCDGETKCTGSSARRAYTCSNHGHVRRNAVACDEYIAGVVVARLSQPDVAELLRPPARPGTDAAALRAEAKRLRERKAALARMFALDGDEAALASGLRVIRDRMAAVESQLAATDARTRWPSSGTARPLRCGSRCPCPGGGQLCGC